MRSFVANGILLILLILFIYSFIVGNKEREDLKNNSCYAIGHTTGKRFQWKRGWVVDYEYSFNMIKYKSYKNIGSSDVKVNDGYYLVQVSLKNPRINEILFNWSISDTSYIYSFSPLCD